MSGAANRVGLYLAVLQLFFTLTWTVYALYLPRLAAQAGIDKQWVVFILLADQVVFTLTDWAMGVWADRVARVFGRLGRLVAALTGASCLAFLLLPFIAPAAGPALFLALTLVWTVTSSALRAPPLVLIGKYAAAPSRAWLSSLYMFGLGLAGAAAPYLTVGLRDADPRWPFALSSIAVLAAALGIGWAERALAGAKPAEAAASPKLGPELLAFLAGIVLAGIGFQIHFSLNSAPAYLRFAKPADLEHLMPVFWIGFNLLVLPATLAVQRYGGVAVMASGMLVGAAAAWAASHAGVLSSLLAAQFIAGAAWGFVLTAAMSAALSFGNTGAEGKVTGAAFSMLALATVARIAIVAAQLNQDPAFATALAYAPIAAWVLAALLLAFAVRVRPA
jgi:MFS family permease